MFVKRIIFMVCCVWLTNISALTTHQNIVIQQWTLANGARVYFVPTHQLPMVDIQVLFNAGSARDATQPGLAQLTNAMLNDGSHQHTAQQLAIELDKIGAQFNNNCTRDAASVNLRSLTNPQQLTPALQLFADIINDPIFPEQEFQREQKSALIAIAASQQEPSAIASTTLFQLLYQNTPYAEPVLGQEASVKKISVTALKDFYKQYYVGKNALVVMVGDLSRPQAESIAQNLVAKLPAGVAAESLSLARLDNKASTKKIAFPSQQNTIMLGQVGINYNDPNFYALTVGNFILGGNPGVSRLFNEVRNKHGYSYQIASYFSPLLAKGPFVISLQTKSAQTLPAITIIKDAYNSFISQGPTPVELTSAKKSITGSFPLRLDSNSAILSAVAVIGFYQLPLDFLDTFNEHINAVTAEQIIQAFQHLPYSQMNTVIVGQ